MDLSELAEIINLSVNDYPTVSWFVMLNDFNPGVFLEN